MKLTILILAVFLILPFTNAVINVRSPTIGRLSRTLLRRNGLINRSTLRTFTSLQRRLISRRRCEVRICYALEGSSQVTGRDLRFQRDFINLVSAIVSIDRTTRFSALQYGLRNVDLSTPAQLMPFVQRVNRARVVNAPRKFVAAGVGGCIRQLGRGARNGRIVLIGDGRSDFGGSSDFSSQFRGQISAVAVGRADFAGLRRITGNGDIFRIASYRAIGRVVDDVVLGVCGV